MKLKLKFFIIFTCLMAYSQLMAQEGSEAENNFFEYYSRNKDILNQEAPYAETLENFAEYHDVLLRALRDFENTIPYEDEFPVEGKTTEYQRIFRSLQLFKLLLKEVNADAKGQVCYYGGWASRMVGGKCQSPWKNKNDMELKKLGPTYNSNYNCGGENLFRCNPLLFGPGKNGKGICIRFKKISEISAKCFVESRDQIEKIYENFKNDLAFRKQYLATVAQMVQFCSGRTTYPACKILVFQTSDVVAKSCGGTFDLNQLLSKETLHNLSKEFDRIMDRTETPITPPKTEVVVNEEVEKPNDDSVTAVPIQICKLYKEFKDKGVPSVPLLQALTYYNEGKSKLGNERYLSIADYSQKSDKKRFYLLDLETGDVSQEKVSHGSGNQNGTRLGDKNHDGMLDRCTSGGGSRMNMTRPGFYKVENYYTSSSHIGKWPSLVAGSKQNGMRLVGLSSTNDDVLGKGIVMHEANYNFDGSAIMGRSYGCPAFVPKKGAPLMAKMKGGSLFYAYAPVCAGEMTKVLEDPKVKNWKETCKGE